MILRKYRNSDTSKIKFSDVRQTESQPTSSPSVYYEDVNADTTTGRIRSQPSRDSSGQGRPAPSGGHDYLNVPRTTEFSQQQSSTYDSLDTDATGERSPYDTLNM